MITEIYTREFISIYLYWVAIVNRFGSMWRGIFGGGMVSFVVDGCFFKYFFWSC